jgi:hypothetical protein
MCKLPDTHALICQHNTVRHFLHKLPLASRVPRFVRFASSWLTTQFTLALVTLSGSRCFAYVKYRRVVVGRYVGGLGQACQTEGPPRAAWVTLVLSWGPHTTINWSHLIKIIAEYFYCLNLETYNVHTNILNKEKHVVFLLTTHVYPV